MPISLKETLDYKLIPFVEKPMRYVGNELNCVRKNLFDVKLHGALCFPDLYDIGMSHFGLQILYHIVNRQSQWALSRCFHPWLDAERLLREHQIPLYTLEYYTPLKDTDWIGFTVQYELQYTNLINMLDLAGLPVIAGNRTEDDPLVIAGGPCMGNPEPIARFVDACVVGDGEEVIVQICHLLEEKKKSGKRKQQVLLEMARIPGVYVPSLYNIKQQGIYSVPDLQGKDVVRAAKINDLRDENYPSTPIVPLIEVVHHRLAVEVMRGCVRGCRFCAAGSYYRPVRERSPESIYNQIRSGVAKTGWRDVGLLSLSTADYSCLPQLLDATRELKNEYHVNLSLPSTRIDALTDEQLDSLNAVSPVTTFTIAPEAGSERLRKVINKNFTDEVIYKTVRTLLARNVQTLKLYFMIGLPTETDEDIQAIIAMVGAISDMVRNSSKRKMVNVSISPFSPKAHTPFQWEKMESVEQLLHKGKHIKNSLYYHKNVKVSYRDPKLTLLETILARGDRQVGDLICEAWSRGARLDGWDECLDLSRWEKAAESISMNVDKYLQEISLDQVLPWQAISTGVSDVFLKEERLRSRNGEDTSDCRFDICHLCGACNADIKNSIIKEKAQAFRTAQQIKTEEIVTGPKDIQRTFHYRFIYGKGDGVKFLGHLDMVSVFHRAFLTAGIPLAYTNGFHPHPRISFGPPLPFGVTGDNESFDVETIKPLTCNPEIINQWLPESLHVIRNSQLSDSAPSLNSSIIAARYWIRPQAAIPDVDMMNACKDILAQAEIAISIVKKGATITKDIRPAIIELSMVADAGLPSWDAVLSLAGGTSCKPSELIYVLCPGSDITTFSICRKECLVKENGKLVAIK